MNKNRVITGTIIALAYVTIFLLATYAHPICFDVFILLLSAFGVYEMTRAVSKFTSEPIFALDVITVAVGFGAFWFAQYYFQRSAAGMTGYFVALAVMILITVLVVALSKKYVKGNAVSTIFVMLYPTALLMFAVGINYFVDWNSPMGIISASLPYRNAGIALMFLVPALTDVFAYQIGSAIKGKKLCPSISPNKTISGAVGGLLGGVVGAGIVLLLSYIAVSARINLFGLKMLTDGWGTTAVNYIILGLFGSVFDQIGDLAASFVKRRAAIKDYSNLLPGHGGILDRVDGFMFTGVFYYIYFAAMMIIAL